MNMHKDIDRAVEVLQQGGVILYPTDTVWGMGCDATNDAAVDKLFRLKRREQGKSVLVLVAGSETITTFIRAIPDAAQQLLEVSAPEEGVSPKPLTIIYPDAQNVSRAILADDGSLGIRVTYEKFSNLLCRQLGKPLVSTSANFAGRPTPKAFCEIDSKLLEAVDYVCHSRRSENKPARPSSIIKVGRNNEITVIRP
ncbi:MAG: threonylcarbamoyl-AMP synthase [Paludibacteraceae bacterium]|nr:threonylcarbamoyl-AMP synthase [Paludibacteraceae bacterium]